MKGISFIVILSIVWSIISAIIEKRKAAEKKAGLKTPQKQATLKTKDVFKADPAQVKIERLRRKRRAAKPKPPVQPQVAVAPPPKTHSVPPIVPLPSEESLIERITPLQKGGFDGKSSRKASKQRSKSAKQLSQMLRKRKNLKTAIVLSEVLNKPLVRRA